MQSTAVRTKAAKECGDEHVLRGREPLQMGWYELASTLVEGQTVLDVGCGSGEGLKVLQRRAKSALGIDLDPRLSREDIRICHITDLPEKSFDVVVCIDVIEHIQDDHAFVKQLVRVARSRLFVSTPNYTASRNRHPYHVREYLPYELEGMFLPFGRVQVWGGDSRGEERQVIRRKRTYYFINRLYNFWPTVLLAKVLRRLLLTRVWAHQALVVDVGGAAVSGTGQLP